MHKLKQRVFSVKHFYSFLAETGRKGVLSKEKLQRWGTTLQEFQAVMQPGERADLRSIDIEGVSKRYIERVSNQNISITPWLIHTHKTDLQNAIGNFIAYTINPLKYCDSMSKKNSPKPTQSHAPIELSAAELSTRRARVSSASAL